MKEMFENLPEFLRRPDPERYILSDRYLVVDLETTNVEKGTYLDSRNRLLCISWRDVRGDYHGLYFSGDRYEEELERGGFVSDFLEADVVVAHNAVFEIGWLSNVLGRRRVVSKFWFCTQVGEWVVAGNRQFGRLASLDDASRRLQVGVRKDDFGGTWVRTGNNPEDLPSRWLLEYCVKDVEVTGEVFEAQRREIHLLGLTKVAFSRMLMLCPRAEMAKEGMPLDCEGVRGEYSERETEFQRDNLILLEKYGELNFRSNKQIHELLVEKLKFKLGAEFFTDKGNLRTDKSIWERLPCKNEEQREFVELVQRIRKSQNEVDYLRKLVAVCEDKGGILHGTIEQCTTATHRLSSRGGSSGIQLQNIDRELRRLFKAPDGWLYFDGDTSGLEFRAAAELSGCEVARRFIEEGRDPHEFSGKIIFKEQWDENLGPKEGYNAHLRQQAKAETFKPLYGGMKGSPRQEEYYRYFREYFKGISSMQQRWIDSVLEDVASRGPGRLVTPTGLIFYFPDTRITPTGYVTNTTVISNYPIQMFATADIVPCGVVYMWYLLLDRGDVKLVNSVHDSIVGLVREGVEDVESMIKTVFSKIVPWYFRKVYGIELKIPLDVEINTGKRWK